MFDGSMNRAPLVLLYLNVLIIATCGLVYELLAGKRPFKGTIESLNQQHALVPPPPLPQVPRDVEAICRKTLAKTPTERYANCQALADDLRRFADDEAVEARPLSFSERVLRWVKREPILAGATSAAVMLLLAAAGLLAVVAWIASASAESWSGWWRPEKSWVGRSYWRE